MDLSIRSSLLKRIKSHWNKYTRIYSIICTLPAGCTLQAWPAGPKITLWFPRLYFCAFTLITQ